MYILSGKYKHHKLKTPKGNTTRPTSSKVKKSIFDMLQFEIEGAIFLDLFAGSGAMGIEALSRGAKEVTFVERNPLAIQAIQANLKSLNVKAPLYKKEALSAIAILIKQGVTFDFIYVDPPYEKELSPLLSELFLLLKEGGKIFVEQSKRKKLDCPLPHKVDKRSFGDTVIFIFQAIL